MLPGGRSRSGRGVAVDTDQRTCCRGVSVIDLAILFGNRGEFGTGKSSPGQQRQREDGENVLGRGNRARNCHVVMQLGFYKVEYLEIVDNEDYRRDGYQGREDPAYDSNDSLDPLAVRKGSEGDGENEAQQWKQHDVAELSNGTPPPPVIGEPKWQEWQRRIGNRDDYKRGSKQVARTCQRFGVFHGGTGWSASESTPPGGVAQGKVSTQPGAAVRLSSRRPVHGRGCQWIISSRW